MIHFLWSELSLRKWKQLSKWLLKNLFWRSKALPHSDLTRLNALKSERQLPNSGNGSCRGAQWMVVSSVHESLFLSQSLIKEIPTQRS